MCIPLHNSSERSSKITATLRVLWSLHASRTRAEAFSMHFALRWKKPSLVESSSMPKRPVFSWPHWDRLLVMLLGFALKAAARGPKEETDLKEVNVLREEPLEVNERILPALTSMMVSSLLFLT